MKTYLMNPHTGSVDTQENWLAEMPSWDGDQEEQFNSLTEVRKDINGDWVKVEEFTGTDLKLAREELGVTQQNLADELHMSRVMVALMESGKEGIERRTELAVKYLLLNKTGAV